MGNILQFPSKPDPVLETETAAEATAVVSTKPSTRNVDRSRVYYCLRCTAHIFQITADGLVVCDECDAFITTLRAVVVKP